MKERVTQQLLDADVRAYLKRKNCGAQSNLRALTGHIIAQPLNDCQKVGKLLW
jgi:hypothetical protein